MSTVFCLRFDSFFATLHCQEILPVEPRKLANPTHNIFKAAEGLIPIFVATFLKYATYWIKTKYMALTYYQLCLLLKETKRGNKTTTGKLSAP